MCQLFMEKILYCENLYKFQQIFCFMTVLAWVLRRKSDFSEERNLISVLLNEFKEENRIEKKFKNCHEEVFELFGKVKSNAMNSLC